MTQTTATPPAKPAKEKPLAPKRGKIALVYKPELENVTGVDGFVAGSPATRPFGYTLLLDYKKQTHGDPIPLFEVFSLDRPGLNWVESDRWELAKQQSEERGDRVIQRLVNNGAIRVFQPSADVEFLRGTLLDYSEEDAIAISAAIYDIDILSAEMKADNRSNVVQAIKEQIALIQDGAYK